MAVCNFLSTYGSYPIPRCRRIINPKRNRFGIGAASCCTSTRSHQKWKISKDLGSHLKGKGYHFSEYFWEDYKKKMGEMKALLLHYVNLDQVLNLVDAIQRVGMEHHFDEEIEMILERLYYSTNKSPSYIHHDLYHASLHFRLLRNHGYYVSQDTFSSFKGNDGRFKEILRQDIRGLTELYEASQLRFSGEDTIDEAEEFSRMNLNKFLENIKDDDDWHDNKVIRNSMTRPQHMNIARLTARNYMDAGFLKGSKKGWEKTLSELAKMDFMIGDMLHQEELLEISKWWENVGIAEKLDRARNQPVKWYTWSMATLINNPSLRLERIELTKAIAFIYILDDIFDLYGTIDELTLFTQALNRWEYSAIDTLPEYMRKTYKALLDTTNSTSQKVEEKYGTNPIESLKDTWGSLCRAFLVEARWFRSEKLPSAKEYLENGKISSGVHVVMVHLFFLLDHGRGRPSIHLHHTSTLISSIATILRLSDDLGSAKDEHQDGLDGSYIKCCMNNEPNLSETEARQHVEEMMSNQWKHLNGECFLRLNHSSVSGLRRASLNVARMIPLMYTYDKNQRLLLLEEHINTTKLFT